MDLKDKELVIFDLDGTLAPSKQHLKPTCAKFFASLTKHIKVAVISGGGFPQFQTQLLSSLPYEGVNFANLFLLPTSGTKMYTWNSSWTEKYSEALTLKEKENVLEALRLGLIKGGYNEPQKIYGQIIEDRGSQITFSALGQEAPLNLKQAWDPDHKKREAIIEVMKEKIPEFDIRIGGTTSIDITKRGVNKAYGIHKLEQFLKIPIYKMIFVGDALFYGGNDYPVRTTGVDCIQVADPDETERIIASWINQN